MSHSPADTADPTLHCGLLVTWPPPHSGPASGPLDLWLPDALHLPSACPALLQEPGVASSWKPSGTISGGAVGTSLPWPSLLVCGREPSAGAPGRFSGLESHPPLPLRASAVRG